MEITDDVFEAGFPVGVADFLFDAFEAAEGKGGTTAGFLWGHAGGKVVGNLLIEMEAEFAIQVAFGARYAKEAEKAAHGL